MLDSRAQMIDRNLTPEAAIAIVTLVIYSNRNVHSCCWATRGAGTKGLPCCLMAADELGMDSNCGLLAFGPTRCQISRGQAESVDRPSSTYSRSSKWLSGTVTQVRPPL